MHHAVVQIDVSSKCCAIFRNPPECSVYKNLRSGADYWVLGSGLHTIIDACGEVDQVNRMDSAFVMFKKLQKLEEGEDRGDRGHIYVGSL